MSRLHRFLIPQALHEGLLEVRDVGALHQWSHVLRLQPGDHVLLIDGEGHEAGAVIKAISRSSASLTVSSVRDVEEASRRNVTLYCALLQRSNMELVAQKATEIGVQTIVPLITQRTVKTAVKMERLQKILREATEQCGRGFLPTLSEPVEFSTAVNAAGGVQIFFHLHEADAAWRGKVSQSSAAGIWIGPEGGWTDAEVHMAEEQGFLMGSLGSLVLRAETAAIVATYLTCTIQ